MKQFTKICLMICGCSLILGMILLGIGVSMGARPGQYLSMVHGNHWTELFHIRDSVTSLDDLDDDIEDILDRDPEEWTKAPSGNGHHIEDHGHDRESWYTGNTMPSMEDCEYDESFSEEIWEVEAEIGYGAIQFLPYEGDAIRVQADNIKKYFQCWVEEKELHIEDYRKNMDDELRLIVYLPAREYKELKVELGAGYFEAQELKAEEVELKMGAGECEVQRIEATKEAELQVGAGRIWLGAFSGQKLTGECAAGEMVISLEGAYEDYNYDIESAVGEVLLGGSSHSGFANVERINNHANKKVELDCAIGTIQVDFLG